MTTYSNISDGENLTESDDNLDSSQNELDNTSSLKERNSPFSDDRLKDEPSFASQIKPKYQEEELLGDNELNDDNTKEESQVQPINETTTDDITSNTSRYRISRTECILIFIICCICLSYTCGVYLAVLVGKEKQPEHPEFRLLLEEEFTAKMMTKKLRIPFYVKKQYQPKSKEELELFWTLVEEDWQYKKKFDF